jgi:hypothetical protein
MPGTPDSFSSALSVGWNFFDIKVEEKPIPDEGLKPKSVAGVCRQFVC